MTERNPDGSNTLRHQAPAPGLEMPVEDDVLVEAMEAYMGERFGQGSVFHEIVSHLVHVDVHVVPPTTDRPHYVLYTTGMSGRPMSVPSGAGTPYAELVIGLPPDWPLDFTSTTAPDPPGYWPIRMMKYFARFPHEYSTWLGVGHTVPNGNPPAPFTSNVPFTGVIFVPPMKLTRIPWEVYAKDGRSIRLLSPVPLHPSEMDFKLQNGLEALTTLFDAAGVSEIIDPKRGPVVRAQERPWWRFW